MGENHRMLEAFGRNVRKKRQEKNISQQQLSKDLGSAPSTISEYERAKRIPSLDVALSWAIQMDSSIDELCEFYSDKSNKDRVERNPLASLIAVLDFFRLTIQKVDSESVTLTFGESAPDYCAKDIAEFFKRYKIYQGFHNEYNDNPDGTPMVDALLNCITETFHDLPAMPDYRNTPASKEEQESTQQEETKD